MIKDAVKKKLYYHIVRRLLSQRKKTIEDNRIAFNSIKWEQDVISEDIKNSKIKKEKVSFCTTCKGRLHHLMFTLPKNLEDNADYPNIEFNVLDYSSEDGLEEWIQRNMKQPLQEGRLKFFRAVNEPVFRMSHSKNCIHRLATGQILCNLDADNFAGKDFAYYLNFLYSGRGVKCAQSRPFGDKKGDWSGRIMIDRTIFMKVYGYNELFEGWGYEDIDLLNRVRMQGHEVFPIPYKQFAQSLTHNDEERTKFFEDKNLDKKESGLSNESLARGLGSKWHEQAELEGWGETQLL